jgi:hypothetical protein
LHEQSSCSLTVATNSILDATGAAFLAGGLLHWFVICFHPNLAMKYQAPTAGLIAADASSPSNNENVV